MPGLHDSTSGGVHTSDCPPPPYCTPVGILQETPGPAASSGPYGVPPRFAGEEAQRGAEITSFCDKTSSDTGKNSNSRP